MFTKTLHLRLQNNRENLRKLSWKRLKLDPTSRPLSFSASKLRKWGKNLLPRLETLKNFLRTITMFKNPKKSIIFASEASKIHDKIIWIFAPKINIKSHLPILNAWYISKIFEFSRQKSTILERSQLKSMRQKQF